MRGGAPPDLQTVMESHSTDPVANASIFTTILPSLAGQSRRYRIWAWEFSYQSSLIDAGADTHAALRSNPGNTRRSDIWLSQAGGVGSMSREFPGGLLMADEAAVQVFERSTGTSVPIIYHVRYTVEDVP